MKLIGDLKEKVDKAKTKEEKQELIKDAGMELTEEEMDAVSGGQANPPISKDLVYCQKCNRPLNNHHPTCPFHPNNRRK